MSLCWLSDEVLATMEPVISVEPGHHDDPASAPPPVDAPRKPVKAGGMPKAANLGDEAPPARDEEAQTPAQSLGGGGKARQARKAAPPRATRAASAIPGESAPAKSARQVGEGRQAASAAVAPAFRPSREELAKRRNIVDTRPRPVKAVRGAEGTAAARTSAAPQDRNRPAAVAKPAVVDDLKLISGVGPKIENVLHSLGIYTYAQIASWKKAEREWVDGYLRFHGRIEREDWVKQAKVLAKGGVNEYVKVFWRRPR